MLNHHLRQLTLFVLLLTVGCHSTGSKPEPVSQAYDILLVVQPGVTKSMTMTAKLEMRYRVEVFRVPVYSPDSARIASGRERLNPTQYPLQLGFEIWGMNGKKEVPLERFPSHILNISSDTLKLDRRHVEKLLETGYENFRIRVCLKPWQWTDSEAQDQIERKNPEGKRFHIDFDRSLALDALSGE